MKKFLIILLCLVLLVSSGCTGETTLETEPSVLETEAQMSTESEATETTETEPVETEPPAPKTTSGTALADHVTVILTTAKRGDTLTLAGEFDKDHYVVKLEQGYGLIEKRLVRPESSEPYVQWEGYAGYGAKLFDNYHLLPTGTDLAVNTKLLVLEDLGDCCVVQIGDQIGYMAGSQISKSYIQPSGGGGGGADGGDISLGNYAVRLSTLVPQSGEVSGTAVVLADDAEIILGWYDLGEMLEIVNGEGFAESKDGYHIVWLEGICGYVRTNLAATEGTEPYEAWNGYAKYQAALYGNYYLTGDSLKVLTANATVQILQDLGNCYLVETDGLTGYMSKDHVSDSYIDYGGGGGSGGEWSDPVM